MQSFKHWELNSTGFLLCDQKVQLGKGIYKNFLECSVCMHELVLSVLGIEPRASWASAVQVSCSLSSQSFFKKKNFKFSHFILKGRSNHFLKILKLYTIFSCHLWLILYISVALHCFLLCTTLILLLLLLYLFLGKYFILLERTVNSLLTALYCHQSVFIVFTWKLLFSGYYFGISHAGCFLQFSGSSEYSRE